MSKDIFKKNPDLPEVFITSDDNPFYTQNAAEIHAKTLQDKTIKHLKKPSQKVSVVEDDAPVVITEENELNHTAEFSETEVKEMTVEAAISFALETDPEKAKELFEAALRSDESRPNVIVVDDVDGEDKNEPKQDSDPAVTEKVTETVAKVKLTPKQQAQKDYSTKFGVVPADEFTTKQLLAAIESGEALVAELNND